MKICGLTREEDVDAAVDVGADAVGFMRVPQLAAEPINCPRSVAYSRVPPLVTAVLVTTVDILASDPDEVKELRRGVFQLYGRLDLPPASVRSEFHVRSLIQTPPRDGKEGGRTAWW